MYSDLGSGDWWTNGVHCQSGYIILKRTKDIKNINCNIGIVHGKTYKSVFGVDPCHHVIGSGFSYKKKVTNNLQSSTN